MTREEAAKDPKRNPKKRRANYTQNQERQPGKTSHYNQAQKPHSIRHGRKKRHTRPQNPPRMKENPHNIPKAHSGPYMKPERATDPQPASIQSENGARTAETRNGNRENGHGPQTAHHKPHRATKRPQPEQTPTESPKARTSPNFKASDKTRTKTDANTEKAKNDRFLRSALIEVPIYGPSEFFPGWAGAYTRGG